MFAEDSAITAYFSLIETISEFHHDTTSISLFYSADTFVIFCVCDKLG